jgi:signal transduction histidine kinase
VTDAQALTVRDLYARRLTEINRALTYARSLNDVLGLTIDCAAELLNAPRALLMLNGEDGLLHIRAARGIDHADVERFREPLDENLLTRLTGLLGDVPVESFLGVPLVVQGSVIGILAVGLEPGRTPDPDSEWLLSSLADQAAVALDSTRNDDVRQLLETRLHELEREQEGKNRAIEILSHDLRTPLSAIMGYTTLMSSEVIGPVNDRQLNALQRIKSVCDHMESILSNVLEMARLSGGRFTVSPEPVQVTDVIESALDVIRPVAERGGILLAVSQAAGFFVTTDASRLRLVLIHLLDNAIKYSPEGLTVSVRHATVDRGGRPWAQIEVIDEGPGIARDRQREIFEPYVRRDGASERARSGVGLGLAIAQGTIQRLGGTLGVESSPGRGACFRILLPLDYPATAR